MIRITALIICLLLAIPALGQVTLTVDESVAVDINSLQDYADLVGRDVKYLKALWVARKDSMEVYTRGNLTMDKTDGGDYSAICGVIGPHNHSEQFDSTDFYFYTNADTRDTLRLRNGTHIEMIMKMSSKHAGDAVLLSWDNVGYILSRSDQYAIRVGDQTSTEYAYSGVDIEDDKNHVLGVYINADSISLSVDNGVNYNEPHGRTAPYVNGAVDNFIIGSRGVGVGGSDPLLGRISLVAMWDFESSPPPATSFPTDLLWDSLTAKGININTNDNVFATLQAALDYARTDLTTAGQVDTIDVLAGEHHARCEVLDSLLVIRGIGPTPDGSHIYPLLGTGDAELPSIWIADTCRVLQEGVDSTYGITVQGLLFHDVENMGIGIYGNVKDTYIKYCVFANFETGIKIEQEFLRDTTRVINCTFDTNQDNDNIFGVWAGSTNQGPVQVYDSVISHLDGSTANIGLYEQPGGADEFKYTFTWFYNNTTNQTNCTRIGDAMTNTPPRYVNRSQYNYYLRYDSPLFTTTSLGEEFIGALGLNPNRGGMPWFMKGVIIGD